MDVDLLSRMVKDLVKDSDTVSLPGLGSFVAEFVPATFTDRGYTIQPPYRRLYFSPRTGEDNLLVSLYARENGISEDEAAVRLSEFFINMKTVLKEKKNIVLPGLGRLRATMENHFFFVADENLDIYPEGYALPPVSLKTHPEPVPEAPQEVYVAPESEPVEVPEPEPVEVAASEEEEVTVTEEATPASEEVTPAAEIKEEPVPVKKKSPWKVFWKIVMWIAIVALVLLIALAVVGRVAPEFLDRYLYSADELQILKN